MVGSADGPGSGSAGSGSSGNDPGPSGQGGPSGTGGGRGGGRGSKSGKSRSSRTGKPTGFTSRAQKGFISERNIGIPGIVPDVVARPGMTKAQIAKAEKSMKTRNQVFGLFTSVMTSQIPGMGLINQGMKALNGKRAEKGLPSVSEADVLSEAQKVEGRLGRRSLNAKKAELSKSIFGGFTDSAMNAGAVDAFGNPANRLRVGGK